MGLFALVRDQSLFQVILDNGQIVRGWEVESNEEMNEILSNVEQSKGEHRHKRGIFILEDKLFSSKEDMLLFTQSSSFEEYSDIEYINIYGEEVLEHIHILKDDLFDQLDIDTLVLTKQSLMQIDMHIEKNFDVEEFYSKNIGCYFGVRGAVLYNVIYGEYALLR